MDIEFLNGGVPVLIQSVKVGNYLGAANGGTGRIIPSSPLDLDFQTFRLRRNNENKVSFLTSLNHYWGVKNENGNRLQADSNTVGESEMFEIVRNPDDLKLIRIKAHNGFFLQVKSSTVVQADFGSVSGWEDEDDDPSVFTMTIMQYKPGAQFRLWSPSYQKYLGARNAGGREIIASITVPLFWEYFRFGTINEKNVSFKVSKGQFMGLDGNKNLVAVSNTQGESEKFVIVRNQYDPDRIRIRGPNGLFLQVKSRRQVTADYNGDNGWGNDDPSVFLVTVFGHETGELNIQLKTVLDGYYLSAENGGGATIVADSAAALAWETFRVSTINEEGFSFRVFNRQFMGLENSTNRLVAVSRTADTSEAFEIIKNHDDPRYVRIKAPNGKFLQVKSPDLVAADFNGANGWETEDPSVFHLTVRSKSPIITIFEVPPVL